MDLAEKIRHALEVINYIYLSYHAEVVRLLEETKTSTALYLNKRCWEEIKNYLKLYSSDERDLIVKAFCNQHGWLRLVV